MSENDLYNKNFEEKNYTTLISVKNPTNFVSTTFLYDDFFLTALLIVVKLNFSDAPMLRITYQSCSLRSPPSAASSPDTLQICAHFGEGVGVRSGARRRVTLTGYHEQN